MAKKITYITRDGRKFVKHDGQKLTSPYDHVGKRFRTFDGNTYMGYPGKLTGRRLEWHKSRGHYVRNIKLADGWWHYVHVPVKVRGNWHPGGDRSYR